MDNLNLLRNIFGSSQGRHPMDEIPNPIDGVRFPQENPVNWPDFEPTVGIGNNAPNLEQEHAFKTDALNKFIESINAMPQRENFKPSGWRRLGAGIIGGFQGGDRGQDFLNAPYNTALSDWGTKNKALGQAAQFERLGESAESQALSRSQLDRYRTEENDRKTKEGQAKISQGDERLKLDQAKLEVQRELLNGGTIVHDEVSGKTYLNTKNGRIIEVPINSLTEAEKVRLATEGRLKVVAAQGQNAKEVAAIPRTVNTTGTTTTVSTGGKEDKETPAEEKVRRYNKAQEIFNTRPDLRDYIDLGALGTNEFTIKASGDSDTDALVQSLIYNRPNDVSLDPNAAPGKVTTSNRQSTSVSSKGEAPVSRFTPKESTGTPPPVEQRKKGMKHTFPNGNVGEWDGTKWVPITVKSK